MSSSPSHDTTTKVSVHNSDSANKDKQLESLFVYTIPQQGTFLFDNDPHISLYDAVPP